MTLEFAYIPGIDDNNIINFASESERDSYFLTKRVTYIQYSFFPPKYTDELKVDTDDIDLKSRVNYIRFRFNEKFYYYFIDSVEYINEGVVQLNIRMDTIMTYYFDIVVREGIVERRHINRWQNTALKTINRSYIRENVSNGLFLENKKNYIIAPTDLKWLIVKITAELRAGTNYKRSTYIKSPFTNKPVILPYGLSIGPIDNRTITYRCNTGSDRTVTFPYYNLIAGAKDNRVVDIYVCPFQPIEEIAYDNENAVLTCDCEYDELDDSVAPCVEYRENDYSENFGYLSTITPKLHVSGITGYPIAFAANTSTGVLFDKKFEPAILDENYMRLTVGSNTANITYPMHAVNTIVYPFYFKYICNPDDGSRTYWLYRNDSAEDDVYGSRFSSVITDSNVLSMSLANDPWTNYMANIKGRIFATGMNVASSAAGAFTDVAATSAASSIKAARITRPASHYDKRYKHSNVLKKKYRERLHTIEDNAYASNLYSVGGFAAGAFGAVGGEIANAANALYSAPTPKQLGNFTAGDTSNQLSLWYQFSVVDDIEFVAQYYHKFGNLVNELYNPDVSWYSKYNIRKYYNYLKFADIIISLNILAEEDVIDDITERFKNGVTRWNKDYTIGSTYIYDNVEN